ncbi:EAL domain-containing protein [Anaerobacillus sp. HL2]|nr:EAL domain-containing protein [Anaerobacillus sp. HL2]
MVPPSLVILFYTNPGNISISICPIFILASQIHFKVAKISWAETLVRWDHPESGVIYPNVFLEIAEKTNLIMPLGEFVFI